MDVINHHVKSAAIMLSGAQSVLSLLGPGTRPQGILISLPGLLSSLKV